MTTAGLVNCFKDKNGESYRNKKLNLQNLLVGVAGAGAVLSVLSMGYFLMTGVGENWHESPSFEMIATLLNISGLAIISSNSKYSKYCWVLWLLSNAMFVLITYASGYMGLMFQQVMFFVLDIWGILNWFVFKKDKQTSSPKDKIEPSLY